MNETLELLESYRRDKSEEAFRELVSRYINLVYSTARRLVGGDAHLAEDVSQRVFTDLAKQAGRLDSNVMLGGWLHRHTCFTARKMLRSESRRLERETLAMELNEAVDQSTLAALTPILDEAIDALKAEDRQAILLRFYEEMDYRRVGEQLGSSEEGARKRVDRAVLKLKEILANRGVALSTTALGSVLTTQAVAAAPVGLAASVVTGALAASAASGGVLAFLEVIIMTKQQIAVVTALAVVLGVPLVMQSREKSRLAEENVTLRAQTAELAALQKQNADLSNRLALVSRAAELPKEQNLELQRLRGEVGTLRKTAAEVANSPKAPTESALAGLTQNPEMMKVLRNQQKMGMQMIYQGLEKQANLPKEKMESLNEMLADHVMTNISHITAILKDGKGASEMEQVFAAEEAALDQKVRDLLGDENGEKFKDYNSKLASYITANQFTGMMLDGVEKEQKEALSKQMFELLQEEAVKTLTENGLPAEYQLVPTLNFRNFASEAQAEKNLNLLDTVYGRAAARAGGILTPEQLQKFEEFRKLAINNNKLALAMNLKLMAPPSKK